MSDYDSRDDNSNMIHLAHLVDYTRDFMSIHVRNVSCKVVSMHKTANELSHVCKDLSRSCPLFNELATPSSLDLLDVHA